MEKSKIVFQKIIVLKNGNKLNKTNWKNVVAVSNRPCTNVKGVPIVDQTIKNDGVYYEKWVLKRECKGYIFQEINHYGEYQDIILLIKVP